MEKDRGVARTKQLLLDAYIALAKAKPPAKITVASLCRQANLNRGTFYFHYRDISDFLTAMDTHIVEEIISSIQKNPPKTVGYLTAYMLDHAETVFTILERPGGPGLDAFYRAYHDIFCATSPMASILPPDQRELLFSYAMEGLFGFFRAWWRSGFAADKEDVKKLYAHIVSNGYTALTALTAL